MKYTTYNVNLLRIPIGDVLCSLTGGRLLHFTGEFGKEFPFKTTFKNASTYHILKKSNEDSVVYNYVRWAQQRSLVDLRGKTLSIKNLSTYPR